MTVGFEHNAKTADLLARLRAFMAEHIYPNEKLYYQQKAEGDRWAPVPLVDELKAKAKAEGLWNLFLPESRHGAGLTNLEYAPLCEEMGRVHFSPQVFNCQAPDTGNMETLERFGTEEHKQRWLEPMLDGRMRSSFVMTEPGVASSDATNIESSIVRDGDEYVINGRKWWISGIGERDCQILIFMGKTDPAAEKHKQQSMILIPRDTPGITVVRPMTLFGYDDAPHGHMEMIFENVRVPASNLLLGEGRGFEIAQARLGPGRIHHCMRTIGVAEEALEKMARRLMSRVAFGKTIAEQTEPIRLARNERVRFKLVNDTMMTHPIHLHGFFFELVNGKGIRQPRKHTVNVLPGGFVRFDLTADAPGDWAFHCHLLMHMHAGMFNVLTVRPLDGEAA